MFSIVLDSFVKQPSTVEPARMLMVAPFIKRALDSTKFAQNISLQDLWCKAISFLTVLFSANESKKFNAECSDLLELLDSCFENLPTMMYNEMGELLAKISLESEKVACHQDNSEQLIQDALIIFKKSFSGLCEYTDLHMIQTMSSRFLERSSVTGGQETEGGIEIEISRIVCETLLSMDTANEVAVELFPSLCKLMNSHDNGLRKESADLLSKVDVGALMTRVKDAEAQVQSNTELPRIKEQLMVETERAEDAELDVAELRQINTQLMKEVEQLRAEKEKLEQQVAVLSEGSAYF